MGPDWLTSLIRPLIIAQDDPNIPIVIVQLGIKKMAVFDDSCRLVYEKSHTYIDSYDS